MQGRRQERYKKYNTPCATHCRASLIALRCREQQVVVEVRLSHGAQDCTGNLMSSQNVTVFAEDD